MLPILFCLVAHSIAIKGLFSLQHKEQAAVNSNGATGSQQFDFRSKGKRIAQTTVPTKGKVPATNLYDNPEPKRNEYFKNSERVVCVCVSIRNELFM